MLLGLVWRNLLRSPTRALLTTVAVAVATLAFVFLRTIVSSTEVRSEGPHDIVLTRQSVSLLQRLPIRYVDEVRKIPGVASAAGLLWFGGEIAGKPEVDVQTFAVEPQSFIAVWGDRFSVDGGGKDQWTRERQSVIIGKKVADDLKVRAGDKLAITSTFTAIERPVEFVIAGVYTSNRRSFDERSLYVRQDYLDESLPPAVRSHISIIVSRLAPGSDTAMVGRAIDAHFDDHELTTVTDDEETFAKNMIGFMSTIVHAIDAISSFLLILIGMVVANALAMSVRERTSEYGALRAIGFSSSTIMRTIIGESLLLCLIGTLVGLGIVWPMIKFWIGPFFATEASMMFAEFRVEPRTVLLALGASAVLGAFAGAVPGWIAMRIKTIDALRGA